MTTNRLDLVAAEMHDIFREWMEDMLGSATSNEDYTVTIPADKAARWLRNIRTDYASLSSADKMFARQRAERVLVTAGNGAEWVNRVPWEAIALAIKLLAEHYMESTDAPARALTQADADALIALRTWHADSAPAAQETTSDGAPLVGDMSPPLTAWERSRIIEFILRYGGTDQEKRVLIMKVIGVSPRDVRRKDQSDLLNEWIERLVARK